MKLIDSFLYSQCKVFGMLSERLSNEAGVKRKKDWAAKLAVMMRQVRFNSILIRFSSTLIRH